MNVATIEMPVEEAARAYRVYRRACEDNPDNREDRAIMLGYKALAAGKSLIDLSAAIAGGGLDELGRPRLAVGRAHWQQVRFGKEWRLRHGLSISFWRHPAPHHGVPPTTRRSGSRSRRLPTQTATRKATRISQ